VALKLSGGDDGRLGAGDFSTLAHIMELPARWASDVTAFSARKLTDNVMILAGCHHENKSLKYPTPGVRASLDSLISVDAQKPFTYDDACVEKDPAIAYNECANSQACTFVRAFLTEVFRLKP